MTTLNKLPFKTKFTTSEPNKVYERHFFDSMRQKYKCVELTENEVFYLNSYKQVNLL